jgi:hypothetical protein
MQHKGRSRSLDGEESDTTVASRRTHASDRGELELAAWATLYTPADFPSPVGPVQGGAPTQVTAPEPHAEGGAALTEKLPGSLPEWLSAEWRLLLALTHEDAFRSLILELTLRAIWYQR